MDSGHDGFDLLARAPDRDTLLQNTMSLVKHLGFNHFVYALRIDLSFTRPQHLLFSGYPQEWVDHYVAQNYFDCDPVLSAATRSPLPVMWDAMASQGACSKADTRQHRMWDEAAQHGLTHGITLSVRGERGFSGVFSLARASALEKTRASLIHLAGSIQLLAGIVHSAIARIELPSLVPEVCVELTERERQCLRWSADGKTAWEISQILNISERTAIFHINNSVTKLGAVNKTHAIARALSLGLFRPMPAGEPCRHPPTDLRQTTASLLAP